MTRIIQIYKRCFDLNENLIDRLANCANSEKWKQIVDQTIKSSDPNEHLDKSTNQTLKEQNLDAIKEARILLSQGKIIALPTDTIYGIACSVNNDESLNKLFEIKKRDPRKSIAICVNNLDDIYKWCKVTVERKVLEDLLPGAITVLFEESNILNKKLNPFTNLIGLRIPDDNFVHSITYQNNPLALTSANLSDEANAISIEQFKKLWPKLDAIFDAGPLNTSRLGSTIIDLSMPSKFRIVRKGCAIDHVLSILKDKYHFDEFTC